jgi:hypothetical protein
MVVSCSMQSMPLSVNSPTLQTFIVDFEFDRVGAAIYGLRYVLTCRIHISDMFM